MKTERKNIIRFIVCHCVVMNMDRYAFQFKAVIMVVINSCWNLVTLS